MAHHPVAGHHEPACSGHGDVAQEYWRVGLSAQQASRQRPPEGEAIGFEGAWWIVEMETWDIYDEGGPASGRGWALLEPDGTLRGHLYLHLADDSGFRAVPAEGEQVGQ